MKNGSLILLLSVLVFFSGCGDNKNTNQTTDDMNDEFKKFVGDFNTKLIPLEKEAGIAYFNASISGKDEDYDKAAGLELQIEKLFSDTVNFALLKKIKNSGTITDSIQVRILDALYNDFLSSQADEKLLEDIINIQNKIEKNFSVFRTDFNGKKISDNEVEEILRKSSDNKELKNVWISCKELGPVVAEDVIALVKKRNELAKQTGFSNYHEMSLKMSDQSPEDVNRIFDELDILTRDVYTGLKSEIDQFLAKKYNIPADSLMPWHYQNRFFQEAPAIYKVDLDKYYTDKDLVALTEKFYTGIGMDISDILSRSDLFEKVGKNQHAYCTNIDKEGDIRIMCNVKPNYSWMNTMLHEFGHGVYDKYIDKSIPYTLRDPAHTFTTEAIAMIFGRFASNAQWMQDMLKISDAEREKIANESFKSLRLEQLVFSRWAQVMYRFEKAMYENPDQDLNALWWNLVEQYQMVKKPANRDMPDWATKAHIASYPCYYHNYLLGEVLASQLYYYIADNIVKTDDYRNVKFCDNKEVGIYLIENVFKPGAKYYWNDMIEKATGEKLTPKYYARQFVE